MFDSLQNFYNVTFNGKSKEFIAKVQKFYEDQVGLVCMLFSLITIIFIFNPFTPTEGLVERDEQC